MNVEAAKNYLKQVYRLDCRIKREYRNLEKIQSIARYNPPALENAGSPDFNDKLSQNVGSILELQAKIENLKKIYIERFFEVEAAIKSLNDDSLEEILELRYLNFLKWDEIADTMHYSTRRILQLHGKALQMLTVQNHLNDKES